MSALLPVSLGPTGDYGAPGCWRRARAATCAVVHDANVAHITSIAQYDNEEFHAER